MISLSQLSGRQHHSPVAPIARCRLAVPSPTRSQIVLTSRDVCFRCRSDIRCSSTSSSNSNVPEGDDQSKVDRERSQPSEGPSSSFQHPEFSEEARRAGEASSSSIPDTLPYMGTENADWREFRARLVAQERGTESTEWAHTVPKPEKGSLLLAHPMMFTDSQVYFYQSVILLLDHDETGSYGIILNRPSQYTLGELSLTKDLAEFDRCRLFVGGDVGDGSLQLLHAVQGLAGSVEIVRGVYVGGIEAARQKVAAGEVEPTQFRWFARYAGWGPGQLQSECKRGVWFTAAASPELIVQAPEESHGKDHYHKVLQLLGGDHKVLSDKIREAEAREKLNEKADDS